MGYEEIAGKPGLTNLRVKGGAVQTHEAMCRGREAGKTKDEWTENGIKSVGEAGMGLISLITTMCPENKTLEGTGVSEMSKGLSGGGCSETVGHSPCAWGQLLGRPNVCVCLKLCIL